MPSGLPPIRREPLRSCETSLYPLCCLLRGGHWSRSHSNLRNPLALKGRTEKLLCDQCGNKSTENDHSDQHGVLGLVDVAVVETKKRRNGAEGEPGRHEQRRVN